MKNIILSLLLLSTPAFANEGVTTINGTECTIDFYNSRDEGGLVGGFDGDTFHGAYEPLVEQLKKSGFKVRKNDTLSKIHYFKDTEFLVELKMNYGRSNNRNISIRILNTGKFGEYQDKVFYVEVPNTGKQTDALSIIPLIPKCLKQ